MTRESSGPSAAPQRAVYAVLDLETGGLDPKVCAIGSVAVMTLDREFAEVTRYHRLIADEPTRVWTPDAIAVNGLDPAHLREHGTPIAQVLADLKAGLPGKVVVGHNVRFDLSFLAVRGILVPESICTLELARKLLGMMRSYKLGDVADRLGVPKGPAHDAMGDVETTANVFRELMRRASS
jgi:DNA polymerase III epsilon subunit-like protein